MRSYRLCILCPIIAVILAVLLMLLAPAISQAQEVKKNISFMKDVAPILQKNCFACHDSKKRKGKLDLTTFETLMKGGATIEAVVPKKPEDSFLYTLTSGIEEPRMPPKDAGKMLPKEQVAIIKQWIAEGAKFDGPSPKSNLVAELRKLWQPPVPPEKYTYPSVVNALTFTPDNKKVVVGGYHELLVWDYQSGKLEKRIRTRAERAFDMLFLPDKKTLVVAGGRPGQEGDVRLYNLNAKPTKKEGDVEILDGVDPKAGVLVRELVQTEDQMLCLALSKDGKMLAGSGCDRLIRIWDTKDFKELQTIENHADWVFDLTFSPDGKLLLSCSRDKTAKIWDLKAKESVLTFPGHQAGVYGIAIKKDGKQGITVGEDKQIRFWDTTGNARQRRNSGGHSETIWALVQHPEKPMVISASADKTIRIWDTNNGRTIRTLSGHNDWVYALAISPDGKLLASGSWDGEVRIWNIDDGKVVKNFIASPGITLQAKKDDKK